MRKTTFKIDTYIRPEEAFHFARKSLAPRFPESAHDHDYFKVFLIESGRTSHWINGEMQTLEPGQLAYFRPQDAHAFRADRTLGCQIINVMFRTETAEHLARWFAEACSAAQSQEVFSQGAAGFIAAAGRSHEHVCRTCKTFTGLTPSEYINQIRIEFAAHLLRSDERSIDDVVEACGFDNNSYFYRLFRRQYGTTPRQYRLRNLRDPFQTAAANVATS